MDLPKKSSQRSRKAHLSPIVAEIPSTNNETRTHRTFRTYFWERIVFYICVYLLLAHFCGLGRERNRPGLLEVGRISLMAGVATAATAHAANTTHVSFIWKTNEDYAGTDFKIVKVNLWKWTGSFCSNSCISNCVKWAFTATNYER